MGQYWVLGVVYTEAHTEARIQEGAIDFWRSF